MALRHISVLQVCTGVGQVVFWILFYTVGLAPADAPAHYLAFERAFLVPDAALACVLVAAGVLLRRGHPKGRLLAAAGGGALVFLGLLDLTFGVQNRLYSSGGAEAASLASVALWCVALGVGSLVVLLRSPEPLGAGGQPTCRP